MLYCLRSLLYSSRTSRLRGVHLPLSITSPRPQAVFTSATWPDSDSRNAGGLTSVDYWSFIAHGKYFLLFAHCSLKEGSWAYPSLSKRVFPFIFKFLNLQ